MKKKLIVLSSFVLSFMPFLALAQRTPVSCAGIGMGSIEGIICKIGDLLNIIIPIMIVLGVVFFIWGVVTFVIGDDEEAKTKGRDRMIYGIIGLVVIVAMWGLVGVVRKTFGLEGSSAGAPATPYVNF